MVVATPGWAELLIVLSMFVGGGFGLPLGVPPETEDPLLAQVAPEECVFYTSWSGMARPDPDSGNRTEQLLAEREVQELIAHLDTQVQQSVRMLAAGQRNPQARMFAEAGPTLFKTLLTRPTAVFLSSVRMGPAGPEIKGGVLVNLGEDAGEIVTILERLQSEFIGDRAETVEIAGADYHRFQPDPSAPVITWGTRGQHLVVGIGDRAVEAILERTDAEPPKWLVELREHLPVERRSTVTYSNLASLMNTFVPLGGPQAQVAVDAFGFGNVSAYSSVTGLDQSGFVKRTWLRIDGEPQGVLAALLSQPLTAEDLKPIDHDTPLAVAFRLDLGRVLDAVIDAVGQVEPRAADQMSSGLTQVDTMLGFKLREDLFKALGDVWTVHAAPSDGGLLTGWTMTVQVRDRERLGEIIQRILGLAAGMFGNNPRAPQIRELRVSGQDIHYLFLPGQGLPISPAWCLTDKHLVFTLLPQTLKGFVSREKDAHSLAERPSMAGLFADGNGPLAVVYYDSKTIFRIVYPFLQIGLQSFLSQASRSGVAWDSAMLPSASSIEKHLAPSTFAVRRTPSGVEWHSRQTLPGGSMGASAPIVVALLLPAVQESREAARRTQSRNNLKQIGLAMHNFHDVHSAFPAAHNADKDGKPLLSWRVHVLPYLGAQELYQQFHLDDPWDSDHNRRLIARIPAVYRAPGSNADPGKTVYLGNSHKQGILVPPRDNEPRLVGVGIRDIVDGTSNTIMVVEASDDKAVIWTKPGDFEPDEKNPANGLIGLRDGGFYALFCDGRVRFIAEQIDRQLLQFLFMRDDGNPLNF